MPFKTSQAAKKVGLFKSCFLNNCLVDHNVRSLRRPEVDVNVFWRGIYISTNITNFMKQDDREDEKRVN